MSKVLEIIESLAAGSLKDHVSTLLWDYPDHNGREHAVRAWRVAKPGSGNMAMTIYVVPGRLMMAGDAGSLIIERTTDMVRFVRQAIGDPGYLLGKARAEFSTREFSERKAREWIEDLRKAWNKETGQRPCERGLSNDVFDDWSDRVGDEHETGVVFGEVQGYELDYGFPDVQDYASNLCWCLCILKKWIATADPQPLEERDGDVR